MVYQCFTADMGYVFNILAHGVVVQSWPVGFVSVTLLVLRFWSKIENEHDESPTEHNVELLVVKLARPMRVMFVLHGHHAVRNSFSIWIRGDRSIW